MIEDPSLIGLGGLSAREVEVMELMTQGMPNRKIAERLGMTEGNVMRERIGISKKLNVATRTESIRAWQTLKAGGPIDLETLSKSEIAVLAVMAEGFLTNKAIADHIGVADQAIQIRMKNIFLKLRVNSHAAAVTVWECLKADASHLGIK